MRRSHGLLVVSGILAPLLLTPAPRVIRLAHPGIALSEFFNRNDGWAVGPGPVILRTVDGGQTWNQIKIRINGRAINAQVGATYFVSAKSAWIGLRTGDRLEDRLGFAPALVVTHNGGMTWKPESLPNADWFFD